MSAAAGRKRTERMYTRLLPPTVTSVNQAYDDWLSYCWIGGADLVGAGKPIILERGDQQSGDGLLRRIPPIGIEEKITSASYPSQVTYTVSNPGWRTFQVHEHEGKVQFEEVTDESGAKRVKISWHLSVAPWFGWGWFVVSMAYIVINTMLNNLVRFETKKGKAAAAAASTK